MARQSNDSMLEESKQVFSVLQRKKEVLLEEFWALYPEHLVRNGMRIFIREDKQVVADGGDSGVDGDVTGSVLGKRTISDTDNDQQAVDHMKSCMPKNNAEYWLTGDRLSVGIAILGSE